MLVVLARIRFLCVWIVVCITANQANVYVSIDKERLG